MSPSAVNLSGQVIINLDDSETCPISEEDLFKGYIKHRTIINVLNSKMFLPNYDADLVQQCIYNSKSYFEQNFLEFVDKYLNKNSTIIDIGANIGNHTLYWANESHAKKIYAFEPIPYIFKILKKNIEINNLKNRVILYNIGLADKQENGEIKSFCKQNFGGTRLRVLKSNTKDIIPLNTLDSFNIIEDNIDLLKIDVEGMDFEVLSGALNTIKKYKPIIMIESFPDSLKKSNSFLNNLGYEQKHDFGSFEYLYVYNG